MLSHSVITVSSSVIQSSLCHFQSFSRHCVIFSHSVVTVSCSVIQSSRCHLQSLNRHCVTVTQSSLYHFQSLNRHCVTFSRSVITVSFSVFRWLLPLLTLTLVPAACGHNVYGFSLAPGQSQVLLAAPSDGSGLQVEVVWDDVGDMTVVGRMAGVTYSPSTITQATASSRGSATFVVDTAILAEGR